jgi:hypothetical protein
MTYACTVQGCSAAFNFPYHWYLHETSLLLHPYHFDIWYCGEDHQTGSHYFCKQGFATESEFIAHRAGYHSYTYSNNFDTNPYCLGPRHGSRFWCGFCREVFPVKQGRDWKSKRFDHVAAHFTGELHVTASQTVVCCIADWEHTDVGSHWSRH